MPAKLNLENAKSAFINVRFTAKEKGLIEADAKRRGLKPSEHIRRIMLLVARREVLVN
jgi:hypothetical protein